MKKGVAKFEVNCLICQGRESGDGRTSTARGGKWAVSEHSPCQPQMCRATSMARPPRHRPGLGPPNTCHAQAKACRHVFLFFKKILS